MGRGHISRRSEWLHDGSKSTSWCVLDSMPQFAVRQPLQVFSHTQRNIHIDIDGQVSKHPCNAASDFFLGRGADIQFYTHLNAELEDPGGNIRKQTEFIKSFINNHTLLYVVIWRNSPVTPSLPSVLQSQQTCILSTFYILNNTC